MSSFFSNFHFLRPLWLLALVAVPVIWAALSRRTSDAGAWRGVVDAHLLDDLLVRTGTKTPSSAPRWLAVAGWVVACFALAGPAWEQLPQPLYQNRAARVIVFELGATMSAQDIKPSRFERARYKIADILSRSGDSQSALIAYSGDAFVVAPLTDDTNTVANLVDALDPTVMPVQGNSTGRAIDLAVKLIQGAGLHEGEIVLLADSAGPDAGVAARRARNAGVGVSIIGVGSTQGAPVPLAQGGFLKNSAGDIALPKLDSEGLMSLAREGGGRYAPISSDPSDLDAVLDNLAPHSAAAAQAQQVTTTRYLDRGPWFVLLLLPIALSGFRRGWLMFVPLVLAAHAQPASAFSWSDVWQRPDQQAQSQLDAGNAKQAQALARDPLLRGSAAYRAGDMADAAQDFQAVESADARYNAGNALAKQQRFKEALAAYDDVLRLNPDMADAKANKQAVEAWMKKQDDQNQKDKQDKNDSKDHQGKDQQDKGSSGDKGADQQKDPSDQSSSSADSKQDSKNNQQSQDGQQNSGDQKKDQSSQGESSSQQNDSGGQKDAQAQNGASEADQQAQQDYQQGIDKALQQNQGKDQPKGKPIRLGANEQDGAQDEQQQAMQHWLQRVPDDPGGLLRRKFLLEYQRRQQPARQGEGGE
ncbi:MAG: VWA domain-containing protein [Rudaea sp.]